MTLINYGDEMRFAVMGDAELAPEYMVIVSQYVAYIHQLAAEAENYTPDPEFIEYEEQQTTELWRFFFPNVLNFYECDGCCVQFFP